jgi:hypothetical protein
MYFANVPPATASVRTPASRTGTAHSGCGGIDETGAGPVERIKL